jgi:large subunit ribosomal protein L25
MAEIATLQAKRRERSGKGAARAARRAGLVPAVVYGDNKEPLLVNLDAGTLNRDMHHPGFFARQLDLKVDGQTHRVLARDVQLDPVTDLPLHVDFLRVSGETEIRIAVPVVFANEEDSPGLKRGGVLNVVRHEIEVECPVAAIPESFIVDLAGLEIGDSVHINNIALPERVRPTVADRDFTIATIAAPTVMPVEEKVLEEEELVEAAEAEAVREREEAEEAEKPGS